MNLIEIIDGITGIMQAMKDNSPKIVAYVFTFVLMCFVLSFLKKIKQASGLVIGYFLAAIISFVLVTKSNDIDIDNILSFVSSTATEQAEDYVFDLDL